MCTPLQAEKFLQLVEFKENFMRGNAEALEKLSQDYSAINDEQYIKWKVDPKDFDAVKIYWDNYQLVEDEIMMMAQEMVVKYFSTEHMEAIINFLSTPFGKDYERAMAQFLFEFNDTFDHKILQMIDVVDEEVDKALAAVAKKRRPVVPVTFEISRARVDKVGREYNN